jgi:hypothetical protein
MRRLFAKILHSKWGGIGSVVLVISLFVASAIFVGDFERSTHFAVADYLDQAAESLPDNPDRAIKNIEQAIKKRSNMVVFFTCLLQEDNPYLGNDWEHRMTELIETINVTKNKNELRGLKKALEVEAKLARPKG